MFIYPNRWFFRHEYRVCGLFFTTLSVARMERSKRLTQHLVSEHEAPWSRKQFAFHIMRARSHLAIVSMAWETSEDPREFSRMPDIADMDALTSWVLRMEPLIRGQTKGEIIVVFCNRVGSEAGATYAGTSAVIGILDGEVSLYGMLGRGEKKLLVVDTRDEPVGKLVYRPDEDSGDMGESHSGTDSNQQEEPVTPDTADLGRERMPGLGVPAPGDHRDDIDAVVEGVGEANFCSPNAKTPTPDIADTAIKRFPSSQGNLLNASKSPTVASTGPVLAVRNEQSATPMRAVTGPRLIIPSKTADYCSKMSSERCSSPNPFQKEDSLKSALSGISTDSAATVRHNPRPLEASTPYPRHLDSGTRYLPRISALGGLASREPVDAFTPTTPFQDLSPMSASWDWPMPEVKQAGSSLAGMRDPGTPIANRAVSFPLHTSRIASRSRSNKARRARSGLSVRPDTPAVQRRLYPWSQAGQPAILEGPFQKLRFKYHGPEKDQATTLQRPESPKSRRSSRTRPDKSSEPEMSLEDFAAAAKHLEKVAKRASAESEEELKIRSSNKSPVRRRNGSIAPSDPNAAVVGSEKQQRAPSRGRQRERRGISQEMRRSSSNDSTRNAILHRQVRQQLPKLSIVEPKAVESSGVDGRPAQERIRIGVDGRPKAQSVAQDISPRVFHRSSSANALIPENKVRRLKRQGSFCQSVRSTYTRENPRKGVMSWPISREDLEREASAIQRRLIATFSAKENGGNMASGVNSAVRSPFERPATGPLSRSDA